MKLAGFVALAALATACAGTPAAGSGDPALSLQPLLKPADCEAVPELLGNWTARTDLSGSWRMQELPSHTYRLLASAANSDNSNRPAFDICVAHLGGNLFFDATFRPMQPDGQKPVLRENDDDVFWMPLHLIGRLDIDGNALHFRLLSEDWLQEEWQSGRLQLPSAENDDGEKFLTASSKQLKEFAVRYATDAEAFSYSEDFARSEDE